MNRDFRRLLPGLALAALLAAATHASPRSRCYDLEPFDAAGVPGVEVGNYAAISNRARLVEAYDTQFNPLGLIEGRRGHEIFAVEGYPSYRGINDRGTTVGFTQSFVDFRTHGWMRDRDGAVRTFADPLGEVYLYRVNERNVAVGEVAYGFGHFRPALADRHGLRVVDPAGVPSGHAAYFADINDDGEIVGGTVDHDTGAHTCLLWTRWNVTAIRHAAASTVAPRAINNRGQVAGFWIESEPDPLGVERAHGFIRDRDGRFRTVDLDYPFEDVIDLGEPQPAFLVDVTTKILDLNDRGEIVAEMTGWYRHEVEFDGQTFEYVFPVWTYVVGTPESCRRACRE